MPGMYFVDRLGRVLFYVAGMEILGLTRSDDEKTGY
jgi:hypothetical protein